jgi:serine/threonine protein kinase
MVNPTMIGKYKIGDTIGTGGFSQVRIAECMNTGELYAVKIFEKSEALVGTTIEARVTREVSMMRDLDHPHIVKFVEVLEDERFFYVFQEYGVEGALFEYIQTRKCLSPALAMHFFRQLIYGVEYLHSRSVCHRDLKPENLFIDDMQDLKIGDFDLACSSSNGPLKSCCGSLYYVAPEALTGDEYDGFKADIWSSGIILFVMLAGRLPFFDRNESLLAAKIRSGRLYAPSFSGDIRDLVLKILTVNVKTRYSISQIKSHPAFRVGLPRDYEIPTLLRGIGSEDISRIDSLSLSLSLSMSKLKSKYQSRLKCMESTMSTSIPSSSSSSSSLSLSLFFNESNSSRESIDSRCIENEGNVCHNCYIEHEREIVLRTIQRYGVNQGFEFYHPDDTKVILRRKTDGCMIVFGVWTLLNGSIVTICPNFEGDMNYESVISNVMRTLELLPSDVRR